MKNFSPRAIQVISFLAQDEARKLGSRQLLPEHLVLAILKLKEGIAYNIFPKLVTSRIY